MRTVNVRMFAIVLAFELLALFGASAAARRVETSAVPASIDMSAGRGSATQTTTLRASTYTLHLGFRPRTFAESRGWSDPASESFRGLERRAQHIGFDLVVRRADGEELARVASADSPCRVGPHPVQVGWPDPVWSCQLRRFALSTSAEHASLHIEWSGVVGETADMTPAVFVRDQRVGGDFGVLRTWIEHQLSMLVVITAALLLFRLAVLGHAPVLSRRRVPSARAVFGSLTAVTAALALAFAAMLGLAIADARPHVPNVDSLSDAVGEPRTATFVARRTGWHSLHLGFRPRTPEEERDWRRRQSPASEHLRRVGSSVMARVTVREPSGRTIAHLDDVAHGCDWTPIAQPLPGRGTVSGCWRHGFHASRGARYTVEVSNEALSADARALRSVVYVRDGAQQGERAPLAYQGGAAFALLGLLSLVGALRWRDVAT